MEEHEKLTFTCIYGTFAFKRMHHQLFNGTKNIPTMLLSIFTDMVEDSIEVDTVDFSVSGGSFEACLEHIGKVLQTCDERNFVLN